MLILQHAAQVDSIERTSRNEFCNMYLHYGWLSFIYFCADFIGICQFAARVGQFADFVCKLAISNAVAQNFLPEF